MRPFASIISLEEGRQRLQAAARPIDRLERVELSAASGRVAASDVVSPLAVPPFARSAMDGYAVRSTDIVEAGRANPIPLRIVDRVFTGQTPRQPIQPGTCAEISTGAPIPAGADAVVVVEETTLADADHVLVLAPTASGQNVGQRGSDILPGDAVVRRGDWLSPSRIGALAAVGCAAVDVYDRPNVAVLSTGNEVVAPGMPLGQGQIYDVNRFTLGAIIAAHGGIPRAHQPAGDTLESLAEALDSCAGADLTVFSGGSSVGSYDLVVDLVRRRGEVIFHGLAIKPGKPTLFAVADGKPFFGMPGNPTSCLSNAYVLLVPFLRAVSRLPVLAARTVRAATDRRIVSLPGRHQFHPVRIQDGRAVPVFKGSGEITSLSQADGLIEIHPDQPSLEAGTIVDVTLF